MLQVRLLGRPEVCLDQQRWPLLPERRFQLLAVLALAGRAVERDWLGALFWPERDSAAARRNLRKLAFDVQALPWASGIEGNRATLAWRVSTDVAAFDRSLAAGDHTGALQLYRGPLLDGVESGGTSAFGEWLRFERARVHARWRQAVDARLEALRDDAAARLELASDALRHDGGDEAAQLAQIEALSALDRETDALRAYRAFAARLFDELGVEPSARLRQAAARLQPDATPPPVAARAPADALVGRRTELREAQALLSDADCRLLTITGPGGIGKSRLAGELVARRRAATPDPVWWVALEDLTDATQLPARIAAAVGIELSGRGEALEELCARWRATSGLLVLDNSEHLPGLAEPVQRLLDGCAQLQLLNTSRSRLGPRGERLLPLAGLPAPDADETDAAVLRAFDAVRLFELRALAATPAFDADREIDDVAALVRDLEGWPLAIELAAAWTRLLPVAAIRRDLQRSAGVLQREHADHDASRHASVHASFAHSWRLLAPAEQRALAALAVLHGSFTHTAAAQVADATLPLLAALVDKSLLRADGDGRFSLHLLIRQDAAKRLADVETHQRRHAQHYGQLLSRYGDFGRIDQREALAEIGADLANCEAAWRWAVQQRDGLWIERSAIALMRTFEATGRWAEGLALFDAAAAALDERDPRQCGGCAVALRAAANLHYRRGDLACADATARRALKLARALRQRSGIKACLQVIGLTLWRRDRYAEAMRLFEQARRLASADDDERGIASAVSGLALCEKAQGRYDDALAHYEQALAINRRLGDARGITNNLNNIGNLHRACSRWVDAQRALQEGLALCEAQGFASSRPFFLINLALTCHELNDLDRAQALAIAARDAAHEHGEPYIETAAIEGLARVAIARGELVAAAATLRSAIALARTDQDAAQLLAALNIGGEWLAAAGERDAACGLWRFVAAQPRADAAEVEGARRLLVQHGESSPAPEPTSALPAVDALTDELLARLAAAPASPPASPPA